MTKLNCWTKLTNWIAKLDGWSDFR
jgi:hypothetical protein